jgi:hypothetical protein
VIGDVIEPLLFSLANWSQANCWVRRRDFMTKLLRVFADLKDVPVELARSYLLVSAARGEVEAESISPVRQQHYV